MVTMPRYARLKELGFDTDDSELFEVGEVGMNFIEKLADEPVLGHSSEEERAQQEKSIRDHIYTVPSTEILNSTKLQYSQGYSDNNCRAQQQQQEQQNSENGNPNLDPTTQPTVVAICSHSSTASGASLQEQQGSGPRAGASVSGRWVERSREESRSGCRAAGCEHCHRDTGTSTVDIDGLNSVAPLSRPPSCGHWPSSGQRGTSYRERESVLDRHSQERYSSRASSQSQHPQSQDKQSCAVHSCCNDARYCQRFSRESSPREELLDDPIPGPEKKPFPSVMQPTSDSSYGGCFSQERHATFQRSNSARGAPGLQRSSSNKETPGRPSEMSLENWREHPASRSAHGSDRVKHRVSFSLTENHELETQKLREKWREPRAHGKKVLKAKQDCNQQPLRYNYEQPGFVEREKENICGGKAYTIYGVREVKDCPKGSSGRHHQLVRAFSLRENNSHYTKISRASSVNAGGRHLMPMECETCGKGGIGIVFLGVPDEARFCKVCKSGSGWNCSNNKPLRKKKSIMEYCRKLLRIPQKSR